jgi:hypothetical protein
LLFGAFATALGQGITTLSTWSQHNDPFATNGETDSIIATAPIVGLPGTRVTVTIGCSRSDSNGAKWPSDLDFRISLAGSTLDVITRQDSHCITRDAYDIACLTVEQTISKTVTLKQRFDQNAPTSLLLDGSDDHRLRYALTLTPSNSDGAKYIFGNYIVGFSSRGTDVLLNISPKSTPFAKFLSRCGSPNPEQAIVIAHNESIESQKAAQEALADQVERDRKATEEYNHQREVEKQKVIQNYNDEQEKMRSKLMADNNSGILERAQTRYIETMDYLDIQETDRPELRANGHMAYVDITTKRTFRAYTFYSGGTNCHDDIKKNRNIKIDSSIEHPEVLCIGYNLNIFQVPEGSTCKILIDNHPAAIINGRKYIIATCTNPEYKELLSPFVELILTPEQVK